MCKVSDPTRVGGEIVYLIYTFFNGTPVNKTKEKYTTCANLFSVSL